jgi:hypothetical protein
MAETSAAATKASDEDEILWMWRWTSSEEWLGHVKSAITLWIQVNASSPTLQSLFQKAFSLLNPCTFQCREVHSRMPGCLLAETPTKKPPDSAGGRILIYLIKKSHHCKCLLQSYMISCSAHLTTTEPSLLKSLRCVSPVQHDTL